MIYSKRLIFVLLIVFSCQSEQSLTKIAHVHKSLKEISAIEIIEDSPLLWTIEDSENSNALYGLNTQGEIIKEIIVSNITNTDWEDLTTDIFGNIYIGDFGNNNHKRTNYSIFKIDKQDLAKDSVNATSIVFTLPKEDKPKDFEAFFIYNNNFYLFSKSKKNTQVFSVPNTIGRHEALFNYEYTLKGKDTRITSADISDDNKTVVLLNHDKIWELSDFKEDNFFSGKIYKHNLHHDSQKEGICFDKNLNVLLIDERHHKQGGNIYSYTLSSF